MNKKNYVPQDSLAEQSSNAAVLKPTLGKHLKSIVSLVAIVAVMGLLLAVANSITKPIIEANKAAAGNQALQGALPDSAGFEEVDLSKYDLPETVTAVHKETSGKGYVVQLQTSGNYAAFTITCGIDPNGTIVSANYTETNATFDAAKTYYEKFEGKDLAGVDGVDLIAGATNSSTAYKAAMKDALNTVVILGGGTADLRSEEEIFADNLASALPEGDTFYRWMAVKKDSTIDIFDQVYAADNGAGVVCILDRQFIGVDSTGKVLSEGIADDLAAKASAMMQEVAEAKLAPVDYDKAGEGEIVRAVSKTADGTYLFDLDARGYAWYDDGHGYKEQRFVPIKIKVSIAADGTILDCLTVSHEETGGFGAVAGTPEYYTQYEGKNQDTYTEVEAIAGATYTTEGYMQAIELCYKAMEELEGGAQ